MDVARRLREAGRRAQAQQQDFAESPYSLSPAQRQAAQSDGLALRRACDLGAEAIDLLRQMDDGTMMHWNLHSVREFLARVKEAE